MPPNCIPECPAWKRPCGCGYLAITPQNSIKIRHAQISDLAAIKSLADANRSALGFVLRSALAFGIQRGWVIIAEQNEHVIGFVHYRHCKGHTTVYQICVDQSWRRRGIGRTIMQALLEESSSMNQPVIRLKAPADLPANQFYQALGFRLITVEPGRLRPINVWEMELK